MELAKIERLLGVYFEGNTTLAEEQELRTFFRDEEIPPHLEVYTALFRGFELAKDETSQREITLSEPQTNLRFWRLGIAASLLLAIGVVGYTFTQSGLSAEEEEALAAFKQTKDVMFMFSQNLNEGTEKIAHLQEFSKGVTNISVLDQFNESKNLIFK